MEDLEKRYSYSRRRERREAHRQILSTIAMLLLVLILGTICAMTYIHARGGFLK